MAENNKLSRENQSFSNIKLPVILDFYEFTGIKRFDSNEYSKLEEEEKARYEEELREYNFYKKNIAKHAVPKKWLFILMGIVTYLVLYILLLNIFLRVINDLNVDSISIVILVPLALSIAFPIILRQYFKKRLKKFKKIKHPKLVDIITRKKYEYFDYILSTIRDNYLPKFRLFHISLYEKLFFGNEGCTLVNIESGRMILYGKENIKNVLLEHKHLGASTSGYSHSSGGMDSDGQLFFHVHRNLSIGGSVHNDTYENSEHESETIEHYEWHLDILTDFMEYPNLSFVIDDNDLESVKEAKVIYGIYGK